MIINDKGQDFKTKYNIDTIAHPDSEIVKIYGKNFRLGDVRANCQMFNERMSNMTIFYDNTFQYTAIGLMDLIFEKFNIPSKLPIKEFMNRSVLADKFVKTICGLWGVSEKDIDDIERENYIEILRRSPFTRNTEAFLMMRQFLSTQRFVFKYPCPEMISVLNELKGKYINAEKQYTSVGLDYLNGNSISSYLENMPESKRHCLEIVVVEDAGSVTSFFDKKGCQSGSNIITFLKHHGLSEDQYENILMNDGFGDGNYIVNFIKEGIAYAS